MIIPIRCMSCHKVLADKEKKYLEECAKIDGVDVDGGRRAGSELERPGPDGKTRRGHIMDALGIVKPCCRIAMMTTVSMDCDI